MFPQDAAKALAVLVPAFVPSVWWGVETARLLRRRDDPLLPERMLAARRRSSVVLMFSLGIVAGIMTSALWWAIPLALVTRAAAGFRLRRQLYEETWPFPTMVSLWLRLVIGVYGFYLALLVLPFVVGVAHSHVWITSSAAVVVLLTWTQWYSPVLRALLRTRPVTDPALTGAFADLVTRSGIARPRFEYVNMQGGSLTNAIALPALNGSSVVFTSPLLERLQTDEIVAIAAHEIAHLEYYSPRRLWRYRVAQWFLIAIGGFAFRFWPAGLSRWGQPFVWITIIVAVFGWRARRRQQNETDSDRRAVALTGTPDALARGLAKLNAFARLPRRWDASFEQRATHPSLARRIRDIYAAAGVRPDAAMTPEMFTDTATNTSVTFNPDHLQWRREGAEYNLQYGALSELRVVARRGDAAALVAADRFGHRWQMPLGAADVGRAQRVLDAVDVQVVANAAPVRPSAAARVMPLLVAALSITAAQFGCALVALLASATASTSTFAAAAVACTAAAAICFGDGNTKHALEFAVCAAALAMFAFLYRRRAADPLDRRAITAMGVAAAIALLLLLETGVGAFRLHQSSRALPDASVLLLATAAAIRVGATRRLVRYAVLLIAIAGVVLAYAGSTAYVNGFVNDPLLVRAPVLTAIAVDSTPLASMTVPFEPVDLTLSSGADRVMLWRDDEEITDQPGNEWTVQIGRVGGTLAPVKADDAVFAPDEQVLAVKFDAEGASLQVSVPGAEPSWRTRVEDVVAGRVALTPDARHWTITGWDRRHQPIAAAGALGGTADVIRWPGAPAAPYTNIATAGREATVLEQHYRRPAVSSALARWGLRLPYDSSSRLWHLDDHGRALVADSQLQTACTAETVADAFTCAAFDGTRTRISTVAVESGRILPIGIVEGRFTPFAGHPVRGWLSGWDGGSAIAIRLETLTAYAVPAGRGRYARSMTGAGDRLGVIESTRDRTIVSVYALPAPGRAEK